MLTAHLAFKENLKLLVSCVVIKPGLMLGATATLLLGAAKQLFQDLFSRKPAGTFSRQSQTSTACVFSSTPGDVIHPHWGMVRPRFL